MYGGGGTEVETRKYSIDSLTYYVHGAPTQTPSIEQATYKINRTIYQGADQYDTITELADVINNKVVTQDVTVNMAKSVYGDIWLGGMSGIGG